LQVRKLKQEEGSKRVKGRRRKEEGGRRNE